MSPDVDLCVVRRFYAAVAAGDLDGATHFAADVVWHLPGTSPIAGTHHGWGEIRDNFLRKLGPLSGGTLRVELVDVALGSEYVVAVQHAKAERGARRLDITGSQLMRIAEVRGHYSDQNAFDRFWADGG